MMLQKILHEENVEDEPIQGNSADENHNGVIADCKTNKEINGNNNVPPKNGATDENIDPGCSRPMEDGAVVESTTNRNGDKLTLEEMLLCDSTGKKETPPFPYEMQILNAIDQLRSRKARPDMSRICGHLFRFSNIPHQKTRDAIKELIGEKKVLKVDYKGCVSYRNAAKVSIVNQKKVDDGSQNSSSEEPEACFPCKPLSIQQTKVDEAVKKDLPAARKVFLNKIIETLKDFGSSETGISSEMLLTKIAQLGDDHPLIQQAALHKMNHLQNALEVEVLSGFLDKLPSGNYILQNNQNKNIGYIKDSIGQTGLKIENVDGLNVKLITSFDGKVISAIQRKNSSKSPAKGNTRECKSSASKGSTNENAPVSSSGNYNYEDATGGDGGSGSPSKRGRPSGKKKSGKVPRMSENGGQSPPTVTSLSRGTSLPVCDYCRQSRERNRAGKQEDLLFCKECPAKVHPSCLGYSDELAQEARRTRWQCIDCKTCCMCSQAGSPDTILFCDACDRGYHMHCHQPQLKAKPIGNWICSECQGIKIVTVKPPIMMRDVFKSLPIDEPFLIDEHQEIAPDASHWTISQVVNYFKQLGFVKQADVFDEQEIDGRSLLLMKREDVLTGLSLRLGPALKIYKHIRKLQESNRNSL